MKSTCQTGFVWRRRNWGSGIHGHNPELPYTEASQIGPSTGTPPTRARSFSVCEVAIVKNRPSVRDRRGFIRGVALASIGGAVGLNATAQAGQAPVAAGAVIHAREDAAFV